VSAPSQPTGVIAVFAVNAGVLSFVKSTPTADNDPSGLAIDPSGSYLYAANASANSISIYCIVPASCVTGTPGPAGTLQQVPQSPLADTQKNPVALTLDSTGSYLYVANQDPIISGPIPSQRVRDFLWRLPMPRLTRKRAECGYAGPEWRILVCGQPRRSRGDTGVRHRQRKSEHHFYL